MSSNVQWMLLLYATLVTGTLLYVVWAGPLVPRNMQLDEISVHRINIVEPDGAIRMAISNHDRLPGIIVHGEEKAFDRPQAGIIFYNDEASEIGGLIFGGYRNADGEIVNSGGSLSFDKYESNQIVQLAGVDDSEDRFAGLIVSDSPSGNEVHRRLWAGRDDEGTSQIALMDDQGRKRILLEVSAAGDSKIAFLNEAGEVVRQMSP